ncbi:hypothetical protein AAE478_007356 [Parahypoxylon ruwenzoriense]
MPASVPPDEPLQAGLFQGLKFWVSHRVPMRSTWLQRIEDNGGELVELEKNADYLIEDPSRINTAPGSLSYTFIKDSVEAAALRDPEDYLCRPESRQNAPRRFGRMPFTNEDDLILTEWVMNHQRTGGYISGNKIYVDLEAECPRHTWQSWRDRWLKKLQYRPRPAPSGEEPLRSLVPRSSLVPQSSAPPERLARSPSSQATASGPTEIARMSTRTPTDARKRILFTAEEDKLLIQYIRHCIQANRSILGSKIYEEFFKDFPQHPAGSWKNRWNRILKPKYEKQLEQWYAEARQGTKSPSRLKRGLPMAPEHDETPEPLEAAQTRQSYESDIGESHTYQTLDTINVASRTLIAVVPQNVLQPGGGDKTDHRDKSRQQHVPAEVGAHVEAEIEAEVEAQPRDYAREPSEVHSNHTQSDDVSMKEQFHRDYRAFLEAEGLPAVLWPTIQGRTFELWDLWRAVESLEMEPAERDWQQIADSLGFNWIEHETVPDELRECYEKYLAEFENAWLNFEDEEEEEEKEEEEEGLENREEEEQQESDGKEEGISIRNNPDLGTPVPSSPPATPSLKRSFASQLSPPGPRYLRSPKRRRVNHDSEFPSTPDDKNETPHLHRQFPTEPTPTAKRVKTTTNDSVRLRSSPARHDVEDEAEEGESGDTLHELPKLPRGRGHQALEPETQDFGFDPDTQRFAFDTREDIDTESQCNITPSQQLLLESDDGPGDVEDGYPINIVEGSPTPRAKTRNANRTTPPPRRPSRYHFVDEPDGTPRPATATRNNGPPAGATIPGRAKHRPLPRSFVRAQPSSTRSINPTSSRQRVSSPRQANPSPVRFSVVRETPDDIIDRFCSLGYPRDIVFQALRATTWRLGDAGQVMEMLKRGEELPQRTHGVWTDRDDEALKLVVSDEPPRGEREERKRAKAQRRLEAKHGSDLMELRKKYLWESP